MTTNSPQTPNPTTFSSMFTFQCHRCLNIKPREQGPQPLSCTCDRRYYCTQACKVDDAKTHKEYCPDQVTVNRILEWSRRDSLVITYDTMNKKDLIEHAIEHILVKWLFECQLSDGAIVFPTNPLNPDSWKIKFKYGVYYHFKFRVHEEGGQRSAALSEMTIRPTSEFAPDEIEHIHTLCDSLNPAVIFGYTVVDEMVEGDQSLPYVTIKVHRVPVELAQAAISQARDFMDTITAYRDTNRRR